MNKFRNKPVWECAECSTVYDTRPHHPKPGRKNHPTACHACGSTDVPCFQSKKEYSRFRTLRMLENIGKVAELKCHPKFDLVVNGYMIGRYAADFQYFDQFGDEVVEDVKSDATKTQAYGLRKKLMKAIHGIEVREV